MKKFIRKIKIISMIALLVGSICSVGYIPKVTALTSNNHTPILYYNFDDESASDKMGNYPGTLINDPQFVAGKSGLGQAIEVAGTSYLQLPSNFQLSNQDFTISFLVKSLETKNDTVLFANKDGTSGNDDGFAIMNYNGVFGNVGNNGTRYDTSSSSRDQTALDGAWRHVVITADRDKSLALYVDGQLSSENFDFSELEGISLDTEDNFVLGAGSTGDYLQSALYDEVKIYNATLSLDEIQALYLDYHGDVKTELEKQLSNIVTGDIRVSLGADSQMKATAVTKFVESQLNNDLGINVTTKADNDNSYLITLEKVGITVSKNMMFNFIEKDVFTVATYNIYGWGYPNLRTINEKLEDIGADIVGLQEANYKLDGTGQVEQLSNVGSYPYFAFKEGYGTDTFWGGSAFVSKYPLANKGGAIYEVNDDTKRSYVRSTVQIDGQEIALYNTHIVWLTDPEMYAEYKEAQINELIEAVNNDPTPYKIITGDFNTDQSKEELDQLLLNFNGANGWNNTWYETGELDSSMKIGNIDHIFTTTNIEFVDINVVEGAPSDHDILYADLKLKDTALSVPTQLLDNTLKDANTYIADEAKYEEEGIENLKNIVNEVKDQPITQENRHPNVIRIREAILQLEEKVAPINDPIIYYDFDNDANNYFENYDGKLINEPNFTEGFKNNSLEIGNGYVEIPGMQLGTDDFTISYWFKSNEQKQDTVFFANKSGDSGNDKGMFICNYDGLFANVGTGSTRYDTSASNRDQTSMDGDWHYLTIVGDRSKELSLYVDGKLSSSNFDFAKLSELSIDTDDNYVIGAGSQGGYRQKGNIDEFKVYNYALEDKQILKTYRDYTTTNPDIDELKNKLKALIDECEGLDLDNYTEDSVAALLTALDLGRKAYIDESISLENLTVVYQTLLDAKNDLVINEDITVNKTGLKIAIEMATKVSEEELNSVVPVVVKEFKAALANAEAIYAKANATQQEINKAFDRLAKAMQMLSFIKGDKTALEKLVLDIENLDSSTYLESSWQAMLLVKEKAKAVLADKNAMVEEVSTTYETLVRAFLDLRLKPNKDLLEDLINQTNGLDAANYTVESWNNLQTRVNNAKAVLENPEASQKEVDEAVAKLDIGIKELQIKNESKAVVSNQVTDHNKEKAVATGDDVNLLSGVVMMSALAGYIYLSRKKV